MSDSYAVFWSYAHDDDSQDRGRLLLLAEHLKSEMSLLSGVDVEVFVDRGSIRWGEQWRDRIATALESSTFLIPVLTPRYFKREECRREMRNFHGEAASRGLSSLMLPLLYLPVPGLDPDSDDELVAISARTQYENWVALRLADVDSEEYRQAVNGMAIRVLELSEAARAAERETERQYHEDASLQELGFLDLLAQVRPKFEAWLDRVLDDEVNNAIYVAVDQTYSARRREAKPSQRLALEHREATDQIPNLKRSLQLAMEYSALTIDLHPLMIALIREVQQDPTLRREALDIREGVARAFANMNGVTPPGKVTSEEYYAPRVRLGRVFRDLYDLITKSAAYRIEGNSLVDQWEKSFEEALRDGSA